MLQASSSTAATAAAAATTDADAFTVAAAVLEHAPSWPLITCWIINRHKRAFGVRLPQQQQQQQLDGTRADNVIELPRARTRTRMCALASRWDVAEMSR